MEERQKPIFEDELTPQQRKRQQVAFEKEDRQDEKQRKTVELLDVAASVLEILSEI